MPNYYNVGCIDKTASVFTNNLLGLIIWKKMYGIAWSRNTSLNIEKNLLDVVDFLGYEEYIKTAEPELWQHIIKGKPINYSGLNAFCRNLRHKQKELGIWKTKSTLKSGIYEKHLPLL